MPSCIGATPLVYNSTPQHLTTPTTWRATPAAGGRGRAAGGGADAQPPDPGAGRRLAGADAPGNHVVLEEAGERRFVFLFQQAIIIFIYIYKIL